MRREGMEKEFTTITARLKSDNSSVELYAVSRLNEVLTWNILLPVASYRENFPSLAAIVATFTIMIIVKNY
jgi:hypothetical protein